MSCFSTGNTRLRAVRGCTNSSTPQQITVDSNPQDSSSESNEQIDVSTPFDQYKQCVENCKSTIADCPTQLNCALGRDRSRRDASGLDCPRMRQCLAAAGVVMQNGGR
uniref:Uncharacterized protein n=1 Tax=Plectus sambesii TaxID=2011161 RepID=A0A914XP58_9BILA